MPNIMQFAMNLIQKNPTIANNPEAQNLLNVIQSGDSAKGQQIAKNLCDSYGVSEEEALASAKKFFNIPS